MYKQIVRKVHTVWDSPNNTDVYKSKANELNVNL